MSDWDFLYEMRDRGYSNDEIMEAMACGYAPWQYPKPLFEYEDDYYEDEEDTIVKQQIFENLIQCAKQYYQTTGRYLQIWGELGELYAEIQFGLNRHKKFNQAGSDGFILKKRVEVKTIFPEKKSNQVIVKKQGNFQQLLIIKINENFEFEGKLIPRSKLKQHSNNLIGQI